MGEYLSSYSKYFGANISHPDTRRVWQAGPVLQSMTLDPLHPAHAADPVDVGKYTPFNDFRFVILSAYV